MDKIALVIGATGQIGRAAVGALVQDGWRIRAASRGERSVDWAADWPVQALRVDRDDRAQLAAAVGAGCEVVVDTVAYGSAHARQLLDLAGRIGSAVVISSGAVYVDEHGRDLVDDDARFPVPIPESQPTVAAGDGSYATEKRALEQDLLAAGPDLPVTLLRAGAIHGPHTVHPREWYFVKRCLDRRPVRVLTYGGQSRFHPASTRNIAELIRLAAARPGSRVLNAGDPQVPTVREIGAAIAAVLDQDADEVLIDGPSPAPPVGETPWSLASPCVFDMTAAARELDYRPVTGYVESLPATVAWLVDAARDRDWRSVFPDVVNEYRSDWFDYAAEDAWLTARR
ncbi:MAG TPA: NAD-dependent epimerase/dehydratase family protein [Micromonosporaceae bacterium]